MTWIKFGAEFDDECANADLSDRAYRTHSEGIGWIYRVEQDSLRIPARQVRRFAGSDDYQKAISELVDAGFWKETPDGYQVVHHADVIRQSLAAQRGKRASDRERQRRYRETVRQKRANVTPDVTRDANGDVTRDTTGDVAETQTDRQTLTKGRQKYKGPSR